MWIKHEIDTPLQKLDRLQKKKNVKMEIRQFSAPTTMQTKYRQLQISRNRIKVNDHILWRSEQNVECWIHLSATQERILADSVYAIIANQSMLKECVVKVINKSGHNNCSQDNLCLERIRSNIPKILERIRTPTFCAILAKPRPNLQMWDFDPIPSESRNWSNEELPQGQHSEREGR